MQLPLSQNQSGAGKTTHQNPCPIKWQLLENSFYHLDIIPLNSKTIYMSLMGKMGHLLDPNFLCFSDTQGFPIFFDPQSPEALMVQCPCVSVVSEANLLAHSISPHTSS